MSWRWYAGSGAVTASTGLPQNECAGRFRYPHGGVSRERHGSGLPMDRVEPLRRCHPVFSGQRRRALGRGAPGGTGRPQQPVPYSDMRSDRCGNRPPSRRLPQTLQKEPRSGTRRCLDCRRRGTERRHALDAKPEALPDEGTGLFPISRPFSILTIPVGLMWGSLFRLRTRFPAVQPAESRPRQNRRGLRTNSWTVIQLLSIAALESVDMDRDVDPSTVETTLEPGPQNASSSSTMGISHISSAPTDDEGRFVPGTLLGGRYRVIGLLGRGGMGEVYRASDLMLGQSVALKFLPPEASSNPRLLERFQGEVRVARQVSHPNVCRVYDIGEIEGMPFLSMEYVDGEDLAGLLHRIGRLPEDKALVTARQLCAGLQAAHDRGVIHRDLKPQNIMMNKRGQVVIMDFGLAAIADQLTGAEVRNGTPAYMAPEQLKGAEVTARSDIYALGLVLYEIFTGKRPFDGQSVKQLLEQQESGHLPNMTSGTAEVDRAVEKAIRRCLEPDPAKRPSSALAVAAAFPGGDPLAAALAAGETPSPELVAAAGEQEGLERKFSIPCLVVVMGCAVAAIVLQNQQCAMCQCGPL